MIKNKIIVSGITATGHLTIGNYLGAIKKFVNLQKNNKLYIFIADLHALTSKVNSKELKNNIKEIAHLFYACGLDPKFTSIFVQSEVLEHAELGFILMCHTTIGELSRMTQFKDKKTKFKQNNGSHSIPTGLIIYPPLMSADILLYDADYVPVGKDQTQHLELTVNIARRFNNLYGGVFVEPKILISESTQKIMDLQTPTKKMSKSSTEPFSFISLLDTEDVIRNKIQKSLTDSENAVYYDPIKKPGVSNLISIYAGFENITIKEAVEKLKDLNYGQFKNMVSNAIVRELLIIQKRYKLLNQEDIVEEYLKQGTKKAREIASKKLRLIQTKIGIGIN